MDQNLSDNISRLSVSVMVIWPIIGQVKFKLDNLTEEKLC